jgi:hypothetical protein
MIEKNVIDIEIYAKEEKKVPDHDVSYRFKVGNKICEYDQPTITGREILNKAGLTPPEQYQLNQKYKKGIVDIVGLDQVVDLTKPGLERFTYMKLDQTEGSL